MATSSSSWARRGLVFEYTRSVSRPPPQSLTPCSVQTRVKGKALSSQSPLKIELEEDDADALRTIMCELHHLTSEVPETVTATQLLNIAVASDKYDLAHALKYVRTNWMRTTKGEIISTMADLMAASRLFGDGDMFAAHSLELIIHVKRSCMELQHGYIRNLLSDNIIGTLSHLRTKPFRT